MTPSDMSWRSLLKSKESRAHSYPGAVLSRPKAIGPCSGGICSTITMARGHFMSEFSACCRKIQAARSLPPKMERSERLFVK